MLEYFQYLYAEYPPERLFALFWFLFVIEFPRYYLLDILVLLRRGLTRMSRIELEAAARIRLFTEAPFVSIVAPGKNEGKHIYKLTQSLKEQTYRNFEIVIADDGSDDDTRIICNSLQKNGLIDKFYSADVRGGKASAANLSLMNTKAEIIVHLDADSSLDRNAIEEILLPFYMHDNVGGVGGTIKVRNADVSLATKMQALEYIESIMLGRLVTSDLGMYRIISGAFGAFRKDVLDQVGNWDIGPGLDGDLTQKIRKSGYKVVFAHKAVCLTNAPIKFKNLYKQRLRWSKSLVRFRLRKHLNVLNPLNRNFTIMNFITNFDNLMFNLVFDMLWLFYLINLIIGNVNNVGDILVLKFIIASILSFISFFLSMSVSERWREEFPMILYMPLQTLYSGYFLRITRIIASFKEFFFFSSYKDPWNPEKSSRFAKDLNI